MAASASKSRIFTAKVVCIVSVDMVGQPCCCDLQASLPWQRFDSDYDLHRIVDVSQRPGLWLPMKIRYKSVFHHKA